MFSFEANQKNLVEFLKQNKDEFDFSEIDKSDELYNPINMKVIGKMKNETSPVLVLDSITVLLILFTNIITKYFYYFNQSYIPSLIIRKAPPMPPVEFKKQNKKIQKAPISEDYKYSLFNSMERIIQSDLIYIN